MVARQLYPEAFTQRAQPPAPVVETPQTIPLPDGSFFPVKAGETPEQSLAAARKLYPEAFKKQAATQEPGKQLAPGEELAKGVERAATVDLPSLWENAKVLKDANVASTALNRLSLFDKIDAGEITSRDQLPFTPGATPGVETANNQARIYLAATPAQREKMRGQMTKELGNRKEFINASLQTLKAYQEAGGKLAPRVDKLTSIEDTTDFVNWLSSNIGSGAVNLAPVIIAGATTGPAGLLAMGSAMGTAESVGNRLEALEKKLAATPPDQRAQVVADRLKETGGTDLAVGIISGSLDSVLGPAAKAAKFTANQVVKQTRTGAAKEALKGLPRDVAEEFVTGGAQSLVQTAGKVNVGEQEKFLTKQTFIDALNDAAAEAAGAPAGTAFNAARAALAAGKSPKEAKQAAQRTLLDTLAEGEDDVAGFDTTAGRTGPRVAGEPSFVPGAAGTQRIEPSGVVSTEQPAGEPAGGERTEPSAVAAALSPDFRRQYNDLRAEMLELLNNTRPTQEDLSRRKMVQRDLDRLVADNADAIATATGDPTLVQFHGRGNKTPPRLSNAMFNGDKILGDIELAQDTTAEPRAMTGQLFGGRAGVIDLPNRALAIAGQDPVKAVGHLQGLLQRTQERLPSLSQDSDWGRRMAPTVGLSAREGFENPAKVAELYAAQQAQQVADAIDTIQGKGKPRAQQGDLFGAQPTPQAEADVNAAVSKLEELFTPKKSEPAAEEFGAPVEGEAPAPTAEDQQREAEQEQRRREAKETVEAPATSTERVLEAPGAKIIKRFFDLLRPANQSQSEVSKHQASKNSAANALLEYDIAKPGQQDLPGLQRALDYLAKKVGGIDKLNALIDSLDGASPAEQANVLRKYGLPDLTSRRGIDAFRDTVEREVQEMTVKGEGVALPTKSIPSKVTGTPIPYREELNTGMGEFVFNEYEPGTGKPRRPTMRQKARQFIISDTKVRAAVRVLRELVSIGSKLSGPASAAATYFSNPARATFGQALNDVAYDLAMYKVDPKNYGAGSTFPGEGGNYALQFQEWIKTNLDSNTVEMLDELIEMHRETAKQNAEYAEAVSQYQVDAKKYAEKQREKAEKVSKVKLPKAPITRKQVPETEAGEQEAAPEVPKVPAKNLPRRQIIYEVHPAIARALEKGDTRKALELLSKAEGNPYYAMLADRLLAAGITAKTTFVSEDTIQALSAPNNDLFDSYIDTLSEMVVEMYPVEQQAGLVSLLKSGRLRDVTAAIAELRATLTTTKATDGQIEVFNQAVDYFNKQYGWVAKYDPNTDTMVFRTGTGLTNATFLHEALHAVTAVLIDNADSLKGVQRQGYDQLMELYNYSKGMLSQDGFAVDHIYGLQDLHEFVSEALTNPEFQAQLRALRYKASPFSLANWFTDGIRKLFNIKKGYESNVLNEVIFATDAMMLGTTAGKEKLVGTSGPKAATGRRVPRVLPKGRPNTPGANKAMFNALMKPKNWNQIRPLWPVFYANLKAKVRPGYLGALTLDQITDLVDKRLPQLANFCRVTNDFLSRKNAILTEAADVSKRWEHLQARSPGMSYMLAQVMHAATIREFDPDPLVANTPAQRAKNADILNMWKTLSPEARAIYREVRNFYDRRYSEYRRVLNRRMMAMAQYGVSTQTINDIRAEFDKAKRKGPYFPLMRRGRFAYQVGSGMSREYYMFESLGEMELHREQRLAADPHLRGTLETFYDYKDAMDAHARESNFLRTTFEAIDSAKFAGTSQDEAARKQELKDNVYQTWLSNQPESSFRNRFMHRTNVEGFSQDALRNFSTSAFHMAYQLSRFEYSPEMFSQLQAAKQQLKGRVDPANPADPVVIRENNELSDYIKEGDRRLNLILNPTDIGTIPSMLSNVGFIWYLTSFGSAAANILGGMIIGLPTIVGQHVRANPKLSYTKAVLDTMGQMKTAFAQIMLSGFDYETGPRIRDFALKSPSLQRAQGRSVTIGGRSFQVGSALSRVDQAAYDRFVADGLIDITGTYDMSGLASKPTEDYSGLPNKTMQVLTYMFHNAERFNREIIAMSAFRLAMEKRAGMANRQKAFAESIAEAKATTNASMFNYTSVNKPRYFQNPVARVVLQFKQFPQQMTWFLSRSLWKSFAGADLATRREARARFVGTMGLTAIFSGATGLWGFSTVASIVNACAALFGGDDEEPFDFELEFKNWIVNTFGENLGTAISSGVFNAAGLDIGSRVKLDEMWFRDSRKNQDEVEAVTSKLVDMLGPTVGLVPLAARAVQLWNEGHPDRALETLAPAFLKHPMIAYRYANEGVNTLKGDPLMEDMGPFLLMMQSLGIRSAELAERQYYNITKKGQEVEITKLRTNLLNGFAITFMSNDSDGVTTAIDKIIEFNGKHPTMNIPVESLLRSVNERLEKSSMTDHGLYIDPRLQHLLNETYLDK